MSNPGLTGLVGWWAMDELSGPRYDKTGLASSLTSVGVGYSDIAIRLRSAHFLSSQSDYLWRYTNSYLQMGGNISFEVGCWAQFHSVSAQIRLISKWVTGNYEYILYMGAGGDLRFAVYDGTSFYTAYATTFGNVVKDVWYYITGFFNEASNTVAVGVNNVLDGVAGPTGGVRNGTADFVIGSDSGKTIDFMNGYLDEVFIYRDRLLSNAERIWLINDGYGHRYEDVANIQPQVIEIDSDLTIGSLPVRVFDTSLDYIGIIEDYYSLSWAERYAETGDFELELPIEWESSSLLDFGNFLYIRSSDKLMIIEDKKLSVTEDSASLVVTGKSVESLLKLRVLETPVNVSGPGEIAVYDFILDNIKEPSDSDRTLSLFTDGILFPAMLSDVVFEEQFDTQTIYDIVSAIAKGSGFGFKIICGDLEAASPKLTFHVNIGVDRSYAQSANTWVVFADKFDNVLSSSFYSSEEGEVTLVIVLTDDVVHDKTYVWEGGQPEPTDLDRAETILETDIDRDAATPSLSDAEVLAIIITRGRELIKQSGPIGLLEGDFNVYLENFKYGDDFYMGDIVQCNMHGIEVGARVIEVVRSYSPEGETTYLGLDFFML